MKVILREDVKSLGRAGDLVNVSDGYARNYLIPRGIAILADEKNIQAFEREQKAIERRLLKEKQEVTELAHRLSKLNITLRAKAGEEGKLFGSVTSKDISEALKREGIEIDKKRIYLKEPIKRLGNYSVEVRLPHDVTATVNITVEEEE